MAYLANKRTYIYIVLIFIILIISGICAASFIKTSSTVNQVNQVLSAGETLTLFAKPLWGKLICDATTTYEGKQTVFERSAPDWKGARYYRLDCGTKELTDSCKINAAGGMLWVGAFNWCSDDNLDFKCDGPVSVINALNTETTQYLFDMQKGNKMMFWCETHLGINIDCKNLEKDYRIWSLYRDIGGARFTAQANSCKLSSSQLSAIPKAQSLFSLTELTMTGGEGYQWVNFVHDWAYGPGTNVFKYQNRDVYCTGNAIFEIQKMQMKDNSIVPIDPNYNPPNNLPFNIQTIGTRIKTVDCCPNEPNCDPDTFTLVPDKPGQTCFSDAQCVNAGAPLPVDEDTVIEQSCTNKKCVWGQPHDVECTSNAACLYPKVCDKTSWTCLTPDPSGYCGDNTCNRDETKISCPHDCGTIQRDYCSSCVAWLTGLFQKETTRCISKQVFQKDCKWYELTCNLQNKILPQWSQDQICPYVLGFIAIVIFMFIALVILILKKKGVIKSNKSYASKSFKPLKSNEKISWRGK
jgi:hypothetical protein